MAKVNVTYDGPYHEGVNLVLPTGETVHVDHGGSVEVDEAVGKNLLAQGTWKKSTVRHPKKESE